ncbi:hypothetical protein WME89_20935 [Sorangium sp. So ce321]|uniref:hypothetical protein n=1 Tax=Sorangium sp. So ce321 TaxID=3133300 RepID=UPI003F631822
MGPGPEAPVRSRGRLPLVPRCFSAAEILRSVSPRERVMMLWFGLNLDDPEDAELFVEGVHVTDRAIAEQERWEREQFG